MKFEEIKKQIIYNVKRSAYEILYRFNKNY